MTLLLLSKTLALATESGMYHFIATTGHSTGWNVAFYIATFLRGMLMIAVVALVGAGWSLLKPFLADREKKLLAVALPLQVRGDPGEPGGRVGGGSPLQTTRGEAADAPQAPTSSSGSGGKSTRASRAPAARCS